MPTTTTTTTPAEDPAPEEDQVPTETEELQARCDILSATVKILCEEATAAQAETDALRAEVRRLHQAIAYGTISPKDRNASRNALR